MDEDENGRWLYNFWFDSEDVDVIFNSLLLAGNILLAKSFEEDYLYQVREREQN